MANELFPIGKQNLLDAGFDLNTNDIRFTMTDETVHAVIVATDEDLFDIADGTIATSSALATPTIANGVFDADPKLVAGVTGVNDVDSLNIYKHTGTPADSFLLVHLDTGGNLPFTPNTGDVTVTWHVNGIFAL